MAFSFQEPVFAIDTTMESFQKKVDQATSAKQSKIRFEVCDSAIQTRQVKQMLICINGDLQNEFFGVLNRQKDPVLKAVAVVAILSASPIVWRDNLRTMDYTTMRDALSKYCMPTLKNYLPNQVIKDEMLYQPTDRHEMAKLLKAKLIALQLVTAEELEEK